MALFGKHTYADLTQLVRACQAQRPKAQRLFYERYKRRMMGICIRYAHTEVEAQDILQEAFIKIFSHIHTLEKPDSADDWVKSIVVRTAINYYHQANRRQERFVAYDQLTDEPVSDDYEEWLTQHNAETWVLLLSQLPDAYRLVINLYLIEGYTHAEIARLLGVPEATARSQYSRGKQLLVNLLKKNGTERHELFG